PRGDVALAVTGGRDGSARVWAIGGDNGAPHAAVDSAEVGASGGFSWHSDRPLPVGLPGAAAVAIERFVYVIGGRTADGVRAGIWRAQVMGTEDAPALEEIAPRSVPPLPTGGVPPGLHHYAVTAVFGPDTAYPAGTESPP